MKVCLYLFFLGLSLFAISAKGQVLSKTIVHESEKAFSQMTLEQQVGQLFMIGIPDKRVSALTKQQLEKISPGFLILFKQNIKGLSQSQRLIYELQRLSFTSSGLQLLLALDQEGGEVIRIPTNPPLPSALALGQAKDFVSTFNIGQLTGKILKSSGVHLNLAPVLDISSPTEKSFLQTRSFGDEAGLVSSLSKAYVSGQRDSGILSVAKHFPGIGGQRGDSHKTIVESLITSKELRSNLIPYKNLIQSKILPAVMITHLVYPNLDSSKLPATFSNKIIAILKSDLNFSGLIMTDDIEMAGAAVYSSPEERAVKAFLAGNDIIMLAWNSRAQQRAFNGLLSAVKNGAVSKARLKESVVKILSYKLLYGLNNPPGPWLEKKELLSKEDNLLLKESIGRVFNKIFRQETENFRKTGFSINSEAPLVFAPSYASYSGFKTSFLGQSHYLPSHKKGSLNFKKLIHSASVILFFVSGPKSAFVANSIDQEARKKTILVNLRSLGSIKEPSSFGGILQLSMDHPDLGRSLAQWISQQGFRTPASSEQALNDASLKAF